MEEIELIVGDSSSIYEFSSKQVASLDDKWDGSWVVSDTLGGKPILEGVLVKNKDIFNADSLQGEELRKTYKIFEATELEKVQFNEDVISGETCTVSGKMYRDGTDTDGNVIKIPEEDRYITVTIKGIFSGFKREQRIKTDSDGNFTYDFNIGKTVKTPANSFFIFQIMPLQSEQLEVGTYYLSVEVKQKDDNDNIIFRREVLQAKLKMVKQGVL